MVELQTNHGNIRIELDTANAPKSSENFLAYVRSGHFDGTVFHRVIDGFMIQGGGFEPGMKQKSTLAPIQNEANNGLKNDRYTLAMARTSDPHSATAQFFINVADNGLKNDNYTVAMARTSDPHSATAQFFINVANNDFLNFKAPTAQGWGYAVFGKVVKGQDIVDGIKAVATGRKGFHDDVPKEDVVIEKAVVV